MSLKPIKTVVDKSEISAAVDSVFNQSMNKETYGVFILTVALMSALTARQLHGDEAFFIFRNSLDEEALKPVEEIIRHCWLN